MFDRIEKGLWWDRTWSLVSGCTPVSAACDNCWLAQETAIHGAQSNEKIKARYGGLTEAGKFTGEVREMWGDLDKISPRQKPAVWSVWSDLFHGQVTRLFLTRVYEAVQSCKQHFFIVCTKRPYRMAYESAFNIFPENLMAMTTVEDQSNAESRIPDLLNVVCKWRGLSIEPMLSPVSLCKWINEGIHWVIVGCESGKNARPMNLDWVRVIRDQCVSAGVPFFFKQAMINGKLVKTPELDGVRWIQVPKVEEVV